MALSICRLPSRTARWRPTLIQRVPSFPRRCYSTPTSGSESKLHLSGDPEEWMKRFKMSLQVNHRISLRHPVTAAKIADAFVPEGSRDKVIVEAYPGPGQLTRALLELPKERIKKIIVLEHWGPYLEWLKPLKEVDPRIEIVEGNPFLWDTYSLVTESGALNDVPKLEWNEGVHPQLQFISHLPSTVHSEQLLSQLLRSMPEGNWLFTYGRVQLNLILSEHLFRRIVAPPKDRIVRCKLSIVAQAIASCTPTIDYLETQPYELHFHPLPSARAMSAENRKDHRSIGHPFRTMTVIPLEKPFVRKGEMDGWDFCLRRLFVKRSTELSKAINLLAPNAQILIGAMTDPNLPESERLDVSKKIRDMDAHDWSILFKAFNAWPFKPEDLSLGEGYASSIRNL